MATNWEARYNSMVKQRGFAWAKYYSAVNNHLGNDHRTHSTITKVVEVADFPAHIKAEMLEMAAALKKSWECPICMDFIPADALEITPCGHYFCRPCLDDLKKTTEPKCAMCRRRVKGGLQ